MFVTWSSRVEGALKAMIYEKTLKLAPQRGTNTGQIVNLMSTDTTTIGWNFYAITDLLLPAVQLVGTFLTALTNLRLRSNIVPI